MSLNDQFEHGRIPLKPLPYVNKEFASKNEFIIDYGEGRSYHMYIARHDDPTQEPIDLTSKIIKEIIPNAQINANQFQITIEGIDDPTSLQDIINFIYKRFTYPEDPNGFDYDRDIEKVLDPNTKSILLRNTDGTILLPITLSTNVFDTTGKTLEDRLDGITHMEFNNIYLINEDMETNTFNIEFPFENYDGIIQVHIGTVYIDSSRYTIVKDSDTNTGTITFNDLYVEKGRRVDVQFIYNCRTPSGGTYEKLHGNSIIDGTIPITKLEKYSDSPTLNDSTSLATSAALNNLYTQLMYHLQSNSIGYSVFHVVANEDNQIEFEIDYPYPNYYDHIEIRIGTVYIDESRYTIIPKQDDLTHKKAILRLNEGIEAGRRIDVIFIYNKGTGKVIWGVDNQPETNNLSFEIDTTFPNLLDISISKNFFANVLLRHIKTSNTISISYDGQSVEYDIKTIDGGLISRDLSAGKIIRIYVDNEEECAYLISAGGTASVSYYHHLCVDREEDIENAEDDNNTLIPFKNLNYFEGDIINVYRNGVRLFEPIDYTTITRRDDYGNEDIYIKLKVRTEEGERITFEAITY